MKPTDISVVLHFRNGANQKKEVGYGSSFLSQSSRFVSLGKNVSHVEILDGSGKRRTIEGKENGITRR